MSDVNTPASMTPWLRDESGGVKDGAGSSVPVPAKEELSVGEVSSLVGISVRTLHHWDEVGLVRPRGRTRGGYRSYGSADVARIHRVLVYRELGMPLRAIATLLDDPEADEDAQLRAQRAVLQERIERLARMLRGVEEVLLASESGGELSAREQAEIFGHGWREDWADEAKQRWGESEEWAQFERRAASMSQDDRRRVQSEGESVYAELAEAKRRGVVPGSEQADVLAERHRRSIGQLFECTHAKQVCLGRMYVADPRFSAQIDAHEPELSAWLSRVIDENARHRGVDPETAVWE